MEEIKIIKRGPYMADGTIADATIVNNINNISETLSDIIDTNAKEHKEITKIMNNNMGIVLNNIEELGKTQSANKKISDDRFNQMNTVYYSVYDTINTRFATMDSRITELEDKIKTMKYTFIITIILSAMVIGLLLPVAVVFFETVFS